MFGEGFTRKAGNHLDATVGTLPQVGIPEFVPVAVLEEFFDGDGILHDPHEIDRSHRAHWMLLACDLLSVQCNQAHVRRFTIPHTVSAETPSHPQRT